MDPSWKSAASQNFLSPTLDAAVTAAPVADAVADADASRISARASLRSSFSSAALLALTWRTSTSTVRCTSFDAACAPDEGARVARSRIAAAKPKMRRRIRAPLLSYPAVETGIAETGGDRPTEPEPRQRLPEPSNQDVGLPTL